MSSELNAHEQQAVALLCERTREGNPRRAIELRAQRLVADFGSASAVRSPTALAHAQHITEIARLDITFDACLLPISNGFRVEVCRFHSVGRQNFSIAHEVGHTFLIELNPALGSPKRETGLGGDKRHNLIEELCDAAAAELLWPKMIFMRDAWELRPSLSSILELAKRYKASVTATARRLAEVGLWKCHFVIWESAGKEQPRRLTPKAIYRSPFAAPIYKQDLIVTPHSQMQLALSTKDVLRGREPIMADGERCYMESMRLGRGEGAQVLTLILTEPAAEYLARRKKTKPQLSLFRL